MKQSVKTRLAQAYSGFKTKAAAASVVAMLGMSSAMAQEADPLDAFFDAIGLGSISAKVTALGVAIVGIALIFKGPDLAKRVIRKV